MTERGGQRDAREVIERLGLVPLEGEGGYFRETWVQPGAAPGERPAGTAILYLVTSRSPSALHRLASDEIFHFYLGDPCTMVMASSTGGCQEIILGVDIFAGQRVQHIVPAGWWQGMKVAPGGRWALLGTTMAPGFHIDDFELGSASALLELPADVRARLEPYLPGES